jgi:pimeloyl-ACP methyl ester carboxylesterase
MNSIERRLNDEGYQTVNISYPSTSLSIPEISRRFVAPAVKECHELASTVHIVTHSMGGILARYFLQSDRLPNNGKLVMLSPPNNGTQMSEDYYQTAWFNFFAGAAATTLHHNESGILPELKEFPERTGIIAAYKSWSLWPEALLPSPNDGMVSVQSMMLKGMDDLIFINSGHMMMRYRDDVQDQIIVFLKTGVFNHALDDEA